jgi:hypothetical protein
MGSVDTIRAPLACDIRHERSLATYDKTAFTTAAYQGSYDPGLDPDVKLFDGSTPTVTIDL